MNELGVRVMIVLGLSILGCDSSGCAGPPPLPAPDDAMPTAVEVTGGEAQMGFARESLRWHAKVEPFSITKHPITWRRYDQCVSAGACDGSIVPTHACKSLDGFIPYKLRHVGRAWVTDFGRAWRSLWLPVGQIERAKGLLAERWLDPLKDGWSTYHIGAIPRSESFLRPLGGAYELEIKTGPESHLNAWSVFNASWGQRTGLFKTESSGPDGLSSERRSS